MKIRCPTCNGEIPASDIYLSDKTAKCAFCNNVFSYAGQVPDPGQSRERSAVGKPRNFTLTRSNDGLLITRRWFTLGVIPLTFFCLFWNGFMIVWFSIAFTKKIYIMALFGSLHGAVGLGMLYAVLAGYFNKTCIRIARDSLQVTHQPFPWPGRKMFKRGDLRQLYSKDVTRYGEHGPSSTYSVQVMTKTGKTIELISGLLSSEEALFIEQEVEKYLRIEDEPVRGEIPR